MTRSIRIKLSFVTMLVIFTLLVGMFAPNGVVQAKSGGGGLSVSPAGYTYDTTPTFKWYKVTGATQYQIQLYKGTILIYTKNAYPSNCTFSKCTLTPSTTLSLNSYKWRVRIFYSGAWQVWLPFMFFSITNPPTDFNSNFNGSQGTDWSKQPGAWWNISSTWLYTSGLSGYYSSNYRNTSRAYANFDFMAKVRRTTENSDFSYLAVRMGSSFASDNHGFPGYFFMYGYGQTYSVWKADSAGVWTPIQAWTYSAEINQTGWNVLRVVAVGNHFTFFINDEPMIDFVDSSSPNGYVGFGMYKSAAYTTQFQVDYAYLRVLLSTDVRPVAISPEQQALNEAAMRKSVSSSPFTPPAK